MSIRARIESRVPASIAVGGPPTDDALADEFVSSSQSTAEGAKAWKKPRQAGSTVSGSAEKAA